MSTTIQQTPTLVPSFDELMLFALAAAEKEKRRKSRFRSEEDRRLYLADREDGGWR